MSWAVVAEKDFQDAIRSRGLIGLTFVFVVFCAGAAYLYTDIASRTGQLSASAFVSFLLAPAGVLVPIIGLVVGYKSIVGERESGSAKLLLGLPHTRRDVLVGKVLGRAAVVTASILIGFLAAAIVVFALYDAFSAASYLVLTAMTVLLALAFVSIGVGISAATASTSKAVIGALGAIVVFQFLWGVLPNLFNLLVSGSYQFTNRPPDWTFFFARLNPSGAYQGAVTDWTSETTILNLLFGGDLPLYLSPWVALAILLAWILVPAGLGYLSFRAADL